MRYKWLGTATLLIESGATRLLVDPYLRPFAATQPPRVRSAQIGIPKKMIFQTARRAFRKGARFFCEKSFFACKTDKRTV